ncbi:MAG: hypothetical protein V9F03_05270 [Microthrixaceae bacterium]
MPVTFWAPRAKDAVRGGHLPELLVGEVLVEIRGVELVGAAELAEHVHRAADDPVGAEREGHTHVVEQRGLGGVAVEIHVGAGGPDDLGLVLPDERRVRRR